MAETQLTIDIIGSTMAVPGIFCDHPQAQGVIALAHGAGAGMRHPFMARLASDLATAGIATLRYEFPYMAAGSKRPDTAQVLIATVRSAVAKAIELAAGRPVYAGGKSMGGRMTSMAASQAPLKDVLGLVFYGFPLHPARKPSATRADHLFQVDLPLLFLQGTRDALAERPLFEETFAKLQQVNEHAQLRIINGADHGFAVLKSSGRTNADVMSELVEATQRFCAIR